MEINKIYLNNDNLDPLKISENQKIECKNGEYYFVDNEDTDNDNSVILKDEEHTKVYDEESIKEEVSAESKTTKYIKSVLGLDNEDDSEYAKSYLINEIRSATSIKDLKKLLFSVEGIEIKLQLEIMDAINEIKFEDDLSTAKNSILRKLK